MADKVVNSSFVLLSKFSASRQENASKTATSHIRETLQPTTSSGETKLTYETPMIWRSTNTHEN